MERIAEHGRRGDAGARRPGRERASSERASLHDVMEMATTSSRSGCRSADGAKARAYLRDRGLTPSTQQTFRLGYAPGQPQRAEGVSWPAKGVGKAEIEACGLICFGDDIPVSYDRFRDRIMFPIPDSRGRIIAFGGRAHGAGRAGKIPELARDRALPQGQRALQFRPRPQGA